MTPIGRGISTEATRAAQTTRLPCGVRVKPQGLQQPVGRFFFFKVVAIAPRGETRVALGMTTRDSRGSKNVFFFSLLLLVT